MSAICKNFNRYIFMFQNTPRLLRCFYHWRNLHSEFYQEDRHLFRDVGLISGVTFTSAILENLVSYWKVFQPSERSFWEDFMKTHYAQYSNFLPSHPAIAVSLFICNKLVLYAWDFGDVLIIVIARAMYKRFQNQLADFKRKLDLKEFLSANSIWNQAVKDHEGLLDMVSEFNAVLSPLIFTCISVNIYYICLTVKNFL